MISFYRHFIFLLAAMLTPLVVGAETATVMVHMRALPPNWQNQQRPSLK